MSERHVEAIPLVKAGEFLLEECRMVLPGIQALFGFQLIAVFTPGFDEKLGPAEQRLHLTAIVLVALAVAIIMAPAAYNRQSGTRQITEAFVRISTRLLLMSMLPLAIAICLECYLIAGLILSPAAGVLLAVVLFTMFMTLWFVLPRVEALQRLIGGRRRG